MSILCCFLRVYFDVSKRVKTTSPIDIHLPEHSPDDVHVSRWLAQHLAIRHRDAEVVQKGIRTYTDFSYCIKNGTKKHIFF